MAPPKRPGNPNVDNRPNRYLAVHGGHWRVSMAVPKELHGALGTRLIRGLNTKVESVARIKREPVVAEFKAMIEAAWEARGGRKGGLVAEAMEMRRLMLESDPALQAYMQPSINERMQEILEEGMTKIDRYDHDEPVLKPEAKTRYELYKRVFQGDVPIVHWHADFMRQLKIKDRSKLDEPRALAILLDWLRASEISPFISSVDLRVARLFVKYLQDTTDLAWASKAKYLGRLKVYWAWLVAEEHAPTNPFRELVVRKDQAEDEHEERPYTDGEIQRLFMGDPARGLPMEGQRMLDVMYVAALSGARLDAIIELKVGECEEGLFRFKRQKKEKHDRDVPIHPDLVPIVLRRIEGRSPLDDLFPDWPKTNPSSIKPRSSYFSKRYTAYTSQLGVREEVAGVRRSLVNFHSFRRWFITKLEREGVPGDLIAAIVGHKRGGLTLDRYSSGPALQMALEAIVKIKLPPLDGSPVVESRGLKPLRARTG